MQQRIRLKHRRLAEELNRGRLSQNGWALRLGISKSYLSELVNGKCRYPGKSTREALLRSLNLDFEDLFEIEWDEARIDRPHPEGRLKDWTIGGFRVRIDRLPSSPGTGEPMFENFVHDLRYGLRSLQRNPLFCLVALATLALGIAVNLAAFGVVNGVLLRSVPWPESERLVVLDRNQLFSNRDRLEIAAGSRTLTELAGMSPGWTMALIESSNSAQVLGARVSSNLFSTLGVSMALGRDFSFEEDLPGKDQVVILSHRLWLSRYGGDPSVIGRLIQVDSERRQVIGVLPAGFELLRPGTDLWITLPLDSTAWYHAGGTSWLVGRLAAGVAPEQAQQELDGLLEGLREEFSLAKDYARGTRIEDLRDAQVAGFSSTLWALLVASLTVLLLAALNLTHLVINRLSTRRRELALRQALGADRSRLNRQLLTEAGLLTILGSALGGLCAGPAIRLLLSLLPADLPRRADVAVDYRVVLFGLGTTLLVWLLLGMLPILFLRRRSLREGLLSESNATTASQRSWSRALLVVSEIMLAQALIIGAGLMIHSVWKLYSIDPGFVAEGLYTFSVQPSGEGYRSRTARQNYYSELVQRLAALPGVEMVGASQHLPLAGYSWSTPVEVEGHPVNPSASLPRLGWRLVDEGFLRTMRIPLMKGREFYASDTSDSERVVILSQAAADLLLPGEDPLGKRIRAGNATSQNWVTIIGVVSDICHEQLSGPVQAALYLPFSQQPLVAMSLVVRSRTPRGLTNSVRQVVWSIDDEVPISREATYEEIIDASIARPRVVSLMLGIFAMIGLLLGTIGVYGLIALGVVQRTREFGIRLAVGARPRQILFMIVGQGLRMTLIGLFGGTLLGLFTSGFLSDLLFEIKPYDPLTYLLVTLVLAGASLLASYLPARQATRVDPVKTLRSS